MTRFNLKCGGLCLVFMVLSACGDKKEAPSAAALKINESAVVAQASTEALGDRVEESGGILNASYTSSQDDSKDDDGQESEAGGCVAHPQAQQISEADARVKLASIGYSVRKLKRENNCYEAYVIDKTGKKMEVYLDTKTLSIVKSEAKN